MDASSPEMLRLAAMIRSTVVRVTRFGCTASRISQIVAEARNKARRA